MPPLALEGSWALEGCRAPVVLLVHGGWARPHLLTRCQSWNFLDSSDLKVIANLTLTCHRGHMGSAGGGLLFLPPANAPGQES